MKEGTAFQEFLDPSLLVVNKLKGWEVNEFVPEFRSRDILKLHKSDQFTSLVQEDTNMPYVNNSEVSKAIIFEYNGDIYVDLEQKMQISVFCWDTISDVALMEEIFDFRERCNHILEEFTYFLAKFPSIPLDYKPPQEIA